MDHSWEKWNPHSERPDQSYQSQLKVRAIFDGFQDGQSKGKKKQET